MDTQAINAFMVFIAAILFMLGIAPAAFELLKRSIISYHKMRHAIKLYRKELKQIEELNKIVEE